MAMPQLGDIESIFHQALEIESGPDRTAWLTAQCANHAELLLEVSSLLIAHDEMTSPRDHPPACPAPPIPSEEFGSYRLVRLLGQGGMSSVYLAERVDGRFQKQVAVKVLAAYLGGEDFLRRWSAEAQFLASLAHPNIPTLLDSGVSPSGHPYLVVEYVEGEMIDRYCDRRCLGIDARVRLFLQVCQAVEYAHRALILHRDLKPSNILVTTEGVAKLLDFGTAARMAESPNPTVTRAQMLTPRYASPEQLRAERPGVQGDVFSLGIILYELLTGAWPFGDPASILSELRRATGHAVPTTPSSAISGDAPELRSTPRKRLKHALSGDLSAILLKALENEPARRYSTVGEFAADITRFLDGRPVEAHPQTWLYRSAKFARRRWLLVTAAAVFVAGLSMATLLALRQAQVARVEAEKALAEAKKSDQVTRFLRGMLTSASRAGGADVTVIQMLNSAEPSIEKTWTGDPLTEASLRLSLGSSYATLSEPDRAKFQLEKAAALFQSLGRNVDAADTLLVLGINAQGEEGSSDSASGYYRRALEALNRAGKNAAPLLEFRIKVYLAGVLLWSYHDVPGSRALLDDALALAGRRQDVPQGQLAAAWTHMGEVLLEQNQLGEADIDFQRAIAADSHALDAWRGLARSSFLKNDAAQAMKFACHGRDLAIEYNRDHLADAAEGEIECARYQAQAGSVPEAVAQIHTALPNIRRMYRGGLLALYLQAAASVDNRAGNSREALQYARESLEACRQAHFPELNPLRAAALEDLGEASAALRQSREAEAALQQALDMDRGLGPAYALSADRVEALLARLRGRR
jgi:serine/threonine protein kinase/tetratricopeptide (TPR) repeat protein